LASTNRRYDNSKKQWISDETNWYTVSAFRDLATNVKDSIFKGDRIFVSGNLRVRDWDTGERAGTSVEIEAETMGHDYSWGTGVFTRTILVKETSDSETDYGVDYKQERDDAIQELKELRDTLASLAEGE
jgi:single-strand DNA-binding protein